MVRHHPQWQRTRDLVRAGRVGTVRAVQVFFSYFNDDPADIRNQRGHRRRGAVRHRLLRDPERALPVRGAAAARHRAG